MEYKEHYSDSKQRQAIVKDYEGRGLRMLHDDFDPKCEDYSKPFGVLTFTDEPAPVAPEEPVRDLAAEVDQLKADVDALKIKAGIK